MSNDHQRVGGADTPPPPPDAPDDGRPNRRIRRLSFGVVLLGVAAAGVVAWQQVKPVIDSRRYATVTYEVPVAPELTEASGETLYRIDPTRSSFTYEIEERLGGRASGTATGSTSGIAGDLAIDEADLAASRVGQIVVNVEQFESDNNLRDARIRQDFLSSNRYPLATFDVEALDGLAGPLVEGETHTFTMDGHATVKDITAPATWDVTAGVDDGELRATAVTTALLSRFDAGPISIAGLVTTADEITLTLELVAVDPADNDIATEVERVSEVDTTDAASPSFARVVQPIIEDNCASCHTTGQMAADHLRLDTAGDVAAISDGIRTVTEAGYMPPWPASDAGVPLQHVARLGDDDLAALAAWSDAGGQLDVDADTEITLPDEVAERLPRQDVTMTTPAYTGDAANPNDYRCFTLDPEITEPTFMTGYTFLPDDVRQIHHAQVFHISEEQLADAPRLEGADDRPGWECYSGPSLRGQRPDQVDGEARRRDAGFAGQANLVAGWVPGQSPVVFGEESGILLRPGDALVLQIHYHYAREPIPDASGLALQLDPDDGTTRRVRVVNPLAPVEIPCAPEDEDVPLCDRETSLAENVRLYGPSGAATEAGLLLLCGRTPGELTEDFDGAVARSSCDTRVPQGGSIVEAMGHMHTLGATFRLTLDPDTPDEQVLLDIPTWSFDWQMNYRFVDPVVVEAGQPLRIECSWDRGVDPGRDPRYIVFAEGTEDEMCFGTYALIPDDQ